MAPPFHSFKVTLGEVLWAPTQIILDELPPSHFLYITAPHHIPRRREGKKYGEGPTQSATSLNGRETAEGWHASCHRCHGSTSRCLVRYNLTSLGVRQAFSAMPARRVGIEAQWQDRRIQGRDAGGRTDRQTDRQTHTFISITNWIKDCLLNGFPVIPVCRYIVLITDKHN